MPFPLPPPAPQNELLKTKGPGCLFHQQPWKNSLCLLSEKWGKKKILQSIGLSALGRLLEIGKDFKDYEYFYLWNFNKGMDSSLYM